MITFRKAFSSFNHPLSRVQSMRNSLLAASSAERPPLPNEIRVIAAGDNAATLEVQSWEPLNPTRTSSSEPISNFFIMVPGNPGAVEPYAFFMEQMLGRAGGSNANTPWTFITLGHSAHSARTAQREGVSLQQQIEHKREVLSDLLRTHPNARLHFGGHSVGAHIVCELLRVLPPENVGKCVLLFPTLSNIGATPNGVRLTPAFNYLRGLLGWLVWGVNLLPSAARRRIVAQMSGATHDRSLDALLGSVLHPAVMQNAFFMAAHEMQEINGLDVEHFRAIEVRSMAPSFCMLRCRCAVFRVDCVRKVTSLSNRPPPPPPPPRSAGQAVYLLRRDGRVGAPRRRERNRGHAHSRARGAVQGRPQTRVRAGSPVVRALGRRSLGLGISGCESYPISG